VLYLTPEARFSHLCDLPEGSNIGRALNQAMADVEAANPELADALPKNYQEVPNEILVDLIKLLDPVNFEGDVFGRVYEFMMGEFAMQEMQKGGEFYAPAAIVRESPSLSDLCQGPGDVSPGRLGGVEACHDLDHRRCGAWLVLRGGAARSRVVRAIGAGASQNSTYRSKAPYAPPLSAHRRAATSNFLRKVEVCCISMERLSGIGSTE